MTTACPESGMYTLDSWGAAWERLPQYAGPGLNLTYDRVKVAGDNIIFTVSSQLMWAPAGGTPAMVAQFSSDFFVSRDGEWVAYWDHNDHVGRVTAVRSPAPVDIDVSLELPIQVFFSPNNAHIASSTETGSARYASTTGGLGVELTPGVESTLLDRGFTDDSRYVLYAVAGDGMYAAPLAGEAAFQIAALRLDLGPSHLATAGGDRIVYVDPGAPLLRLRNLDSAGDPSLVAEGTGFGADFVLSSDMNAVAYIVNEGDESHGLYAIGIPSP